METKSKGLKEQQQHHKKLLAAMLSQDSFDSVHSPAPSVAEEEMEDEDDAMELLGNVTSLYTHHRPTCIYIMQSHSKPFHVDSLQHTVQHTVHTHFSFDFC